MTAERATPCAVCAELIPFGTLCWLRHMPRAMTVAPSERVVVCNACQEAGK